MVVCCQLENMNNIKNILTTMSVASCLIGSTAMAGEEAIRNMVFSYEQVLNDSDVDGIIQLFEETGVVMIQKAPSSVGSASVRRFYETLFENIDLDIEFEIAEIELISPEWAFARTTSSGTVRIIANNSKAQSQGQELFLLKLQANGNWKIARYAASSTN